jgi:hypothetical protein
MYQAPYITNWLSDLTQILCESSDDTMSSDGGISWEGLKLILEKC